MIQCFLFSIIVSFGFDMHGSTLEIEEKSSLKHSLAICYLQNIKKEKKDSILNGFEEYIKNIMKKECTAQVYLHDVILSATRKESKNTEHVILTAQVFGTPEEFEGFNVLESEKALIKYRILYAYLLHKAKMNARFMAWFRSNSMMDSATQITLSPTNYSETTTNYMHINPLVKRVYTNKYTMIIVAQFTASEFDALIKQYCV